jgi:hypothetical protein
MSRWDDMELWVPEEPGSGSRAPACQSGRRGRRATYLVGLVMAGNRILVEMNTIGL